MTRQNEKYQGVRDELLSIAQFAFYLSCKTSGRQVETWGEEYASHVFAKISAHALSIAALSPTGIKPIQPGATELWDMSSLSTLVRAVVDAYYVMFYIAVETVSPEERSFRESLWNYHGKRKQLELLQLIESKADEIQDIQKEIDRFKREIEHNEFFRQLGDEKKKKVQGGIRNGDVAIYLTNTELSERSGIHPSFYKSTYRFLSNYVHTYPFCLSQLSSFEAGHQDSLRLITLVLQYCSAYLSIAVRDFLLLTPDGNTLLSGNLREVVEDWVSEVAKKVVPR